VCDFSDRSPLGELLPGRRLRGMLSAGSEQRSCRSNRRRIMRRFLVCLAVVSAMLASPSVSTAADEASGSYLEPNTKLFFPVNLGPLKKKEVEKYKEPGLGVRIRYEGADLLKADVYVYRGGERNLPSGLESPAIKSQFQGLKDVMREMEKRGYYKDVVNEKDETTTLTARQGKTTSLLHTSFRLEQTARSNSSTERRVSHAWLTVYQGHFVKIRFTYLESKKVAGEKALEGFLADLADVLTATQVAGSGLAP
jgi:hypothetical protein